MKKQILIILLVFLGSNIINVSAVNAQCPMCKISAESNLRDGGTAGKGLNAGILYMFVLPYLLVGTLGILWFKNKRNYSSEADIN